MGDRAQVHIVDTDVWLYTHWGGRELPTVVAEALGRRERWNDPEYLARIIFEEMTGDDDGPTGFGIGEAQHGDVHRVVHINCSEGEMTLETVMAAWQDGDETKSATFTFEEAAVGTEFGWRNP